MDIDIKSLSKRNLQDFADFSCGDESWNDLAEFLLNDALPQQESRHNRTYVCYANGAPAAYVTISADSVKREGIAAPYGNIPTVLVGRLAVDSSLQRTGIAQQIMAWVRHKSTTLWADCRFVAVHMDVENERAKQFYLRQGFFTHPYFGTKQKLMLYDLLADR